MTLHQLNSLTDDELGMALVIVNHVFPISSPKMKFNAIHLTWFKHQALVKKLLDAFPHIKPEAHPIFVSLMYKLGVSVNISTDQQSTESTGSKI